jgi:hypothetical protein
MVLGLKRALIEYSLVSLSHLGIFFSPTVPADELGFLGSDAAPVGESNVGGGGKSCASDSTESSSGAGILESA